MIHEEKWYTCDRCGERIENLVEDVLDCLPEEVSAQIPRDDYLKIMSGESDISIVNAEFDGKDTETVSRWRYFIRPIIKSDRLLQKISSGKEKKYDCRNFYIRNYIWLWS